ncbi:MAG: hypothetical protein KDD64_11660 [Bdellovibrionales bacterium]|nr:hypothetical protein [Bdellovibrionales bacterium]
MRLPRHTRMFDNSTREPRFQLSRKIFGLLAALVLTQFLSGCAYLRIDKYHPFLRSDRITSVEEESEVLSKAKLSITEDGRIPILFVSGTPYERGYQQGVLLREQVRDNLLTLYRNALKTFKSELFFEESYERLRPFIPQEYIDEMHGLAHGAKLPLYVVHYAHTLPSMSEWGGKKQVKEILRKMMAGDLGTSCSNFSSLSSASRDGKLYSVRILDWGLHKISKLHEYPLITVNVPDKGIASANIGWVGFLGAISGMNEEGITLGEMGYGSPPNETLNGRPMPFLLRDVMTYSHNLSEVRGIIETSPPTNSFAFMMSDGKSGEAELYIRDPDRFLVFHAGDDLQDSSSNYPAIPGITYAGHFDEKLTQNLSAYRGAITPEVLMDKIIPEVVMKSNFQNVVYDPADLQFWVSYAANRESVASSGPYTKFSLAEPLKTFREGLRENPDSELAH